MLYRCRYDIIEQYIAFLDDIGELCSSNELNNGFYFRFKKKTTIWSEELTDLMGNYLILVDAYDLNFAKFRTYSRVQFKNSCNYKSNGYAHEIQNFVISDPKIL